MINGGSLITMVNDLEEVHVKQKQTFLNHYQPMFSSTMSLSSESASMCSDTFNSYNKSYSKSSCTTSVFDYIWKVERFTTFFKSTPLVYSAAFPETALYKIKMETYRAEYNDEIEINLYVLCKHPFRGICEVSVIEAENKIPCTSVSGYIVTEIILHKTTAEKLLQYVYNDTLTFNFTITVFHEMITESTHITPIPLLTEFNIMDKYKNLTANENFFAQVIFKSQNYVYEISEELLDAIKSSYFKMMCQKNRKQAKENINSIEIKMNNMSDIFITMLNFIKTGSLPEFVRNNDFKMSELLVAAYRYDVQILKAMCEENLIRNITIANIIMYLDLAITCHATVLEEHVMCFIKFNFEEIVKTEQFQQLPHPYLIRIMQFIQQFNVEKQKLPIYISNI